jgi:hypothetical protein
MDCHDTEPAICPYRMQLLQERILPSGLDFVICVTYLSLGLYRVTSSARFVWSAEGKPGSPCGQKKVTRRKQNITGKEEQRKSRVV